VLAQVGVGPADGPDLVERQDQLGGLLLQHLEVLHDLAGVVPADVRDQEHPRRVLGHVVAQGIAGPELLQGRGGLGRPAGVEVGLAAGVQLVGRGLVRVGRRLARLQHRQLARRPEVRSARLVGAGEARRQRPVLPGQVTEDVVAEGAGVLVGGEVEGQHAVGQLVVAGLRLDRAVDQRRAGRQVLLQDQELALPGGLTDRLVAPGLDGDAGPAAEGDLRDGVLEAPGVDRHAEAGRQDLAVELGSAGR
jgi:hypothetical protein